MKLNKFAYLYSKPLGNHTLKIMKKIPGNLLKNVEISWNFVSPKKWEPWFLHLSVSHSVHRGGGVLLQCMLGYTPPGQTPPADGYYCERYASYWNAFLFTYEIEKKLVPLHPAFRICHSIGANFSKKPAYFN